MSAPLIVATAKAASAWWAKRYTGPNEDKFAAHIERRVTEELETHGSCYLECDYDPFGILLEAVNEAGANCRGFMFSAQGLLPQKHSLSVKPGEMRPKEWYGRWTDDIKVTP